MHRPETVGPGSASDRIVALDALRGFLLFFIFIANLPSFSGFWFLSSEAEAALMTPVDEILLFGIETLVHGKFYTLFSLLFGIGFAVILSRIAARGMSEVSIYRRRLAVLALLGLVHMLVWSGDILLPYALCGFLLIFFRNLSDKALLSIAALLIVLPVVHYGLAWLTGGRSDPAFHIFEFLNGFVIPALAVEGNPLSVYQAGSFSEIWRANIVGFGMRWVGLFFEGRLFKILGVFLIGLWVGRRVLAGGILDDTRLLKRTMAIGFGVGLPANIGLAYLLGAGVDFPMSWLGMLQYALYAVGVVPLALAYAAGFVLLWRGNAAQWILQVFVPLGRMALTNYLMQTLIAVSFFYGIVGQGRMGTYGPSDWLLFGALVIAFQALFSAAWLHYFRFGPFEWLWRSFTYLRWQPMRRDRLPPETEQAPNPQG